MPKIREETLNECAKQLWEALGYLPGNLPHLPFEDALVSVRAQTKTLAGLRRIINGSK